MLNAATDYRPRRRIGARLGIQRVKYKLGTTTTGYTCEIDQETRSRHMYVIGRTGYGKSVFIQNITLQDINAGNGVCLIDFHGDLVRAIADSIPDHRIQDVIFFSPADLTHFCPFNVLHHSHPTLASQLVSAFKARWIDAWGHRLEYILKNTLHLLIANGDRTLLDINEVLTDPTLRNSLLRNLDKDRHKYLLAFWRKQFANWPERYREEAIGALLNKAGVFTDPILQPIFGSVKSLNIREIIDTKKILLCDFSKADMGDDNAEILATVLVTKIYQAARERNDIPSHERHLYNLIVDEFQNATTHTFDTMLSEARKYGLGVTIAHQHTEQLPKSILTSALANSATKVIFSIAATDADLIGKEINVLGLSNLQKYEARICVDNGKADLWDMAPPPPPLGSFERVISRTHERYSLARAA